MACSSPCAPAKVSRSCSVHVAIASARPRSSRRNLCFDLIAGTALTTQPITTLSRSQEVNRNTTKAVAGPTKNLSELRNLVLISKMLSLLLLVEYLVLFIVNRMPNRPRPNDAPQNKTANVVIMNRHDLHNQILQAFRELPRAMETP